MKLLSTYLLAVCLLSTLIAEGHAWPSWLTSLFKPGGTDKKPNVILMFADDMGSHDLGYVNCEVKTPNIDALANAGVKLSNNYVMNVCTPTRHAAMTGRYPFKTMLGHIVIFPMQQLCTPINIEMLPKYLSDNGYNTMAVGKWHLGLCREECLPTNRGFDKHYGFWQGEQDYYDHTSGPGSIELFDFRDQLTLDTSVKGKFNTYILTDWVVDQIKNDKSDKPFFLYFALPNPHTPVEDCPQKYFDLYADDLTMEHCRKQYLGLVSAMDDAVGRLVQALKDAKEWDNTIFIFSSDNGGEHGYCASNGALRGSKGSMFEGGIKALGFVYSKLLEKSGYTHDGLFHVSDWYPTILGMVGIDFDATKMKFDGYDQSDMIMNGGASKRDEIVYNIDMHPMSTMGQSAYRKGDYKLLWGGYGATDGYFKYRNLTLFYKDENLRAKAGLGPYGASSRKRAAFDFGQANQADMTTMLSKIFRFSKDDIGSGVTYLFNIKEDPTELTNLAGDDAYADKVKEMKLDILQMIKDEYIEPSDEAKKNNLDAVNNYGGTWSTGWCNDVDLNMPGE